MLRFLQKSDFFDRKGCATLSLFASNPTLLSTLVLLLALMTALWAVSIQQQDVSIIDRVWGLFFIVQAIVYLDLRKAKSAATLILIIVWGLRLSWHIHCRNKNKGEDSRYQNYTPTSREALLVDQSFYSLLSPSINQSGRCTTALFHRHWISAKSRSHGFLGNRNRHLWLSF